ncbi:DUF4158 domain-containing protein [Nocardiopsis sp. N85]|uniref:DUF4158 domain-containing protein n=1 Tax=Nocardiopsis sp. N85 TaxID=3029400 RepID=UPI00237F6F7F|nr:DUF4158 domain-containing protein [Nocardiopsis sp. N85]MDE3722786.1 DUF4158 domain-containing protein [Nocardiopsis sp. N85]
MARRSVGMDELVEHWTLLDEEQHLLLGKRDATRLGFALLLKYFTGNGRFPRGRVEFGDEVVAFVARQVKVPAADLGFYEWSGRTIEYHRECARCWSSANARRLFWSHVRPYGEVRLDLRSRLDIGQTVSG